jgi:hypothetical protein
MWDFLERLRGTSLSYRRNIAFFSALFLTGGIVFFIILTHWGQYRLYTDFRNNETKNEEMRTFTKPETLFNEENIFFLEEAEREEGSFSPPSSEEEKNQIEESDTSFSPFGDVNTEEVLQ